MAKSTDNIQARQKLLYLTSKWLVVKPLLHSLFNLKVHGLENAPPAEALVVVSNHASYLDPPLLSACLNRPVAYMAKEELFHNPLLKWLIELYGAYPVKRGTSDRTALKSALTVLEAGAAAGIFLEGTRTPDGQIREPKLGAALIAAKAQAPLLPVSLWGTQNALGAKFPYFHPTPITVRIAPPLPPPTSSDKEELLTISQKCASMINALHGQGR